MNPTDSTLTEDETAILLTDLIASGIPAAVDGRRLSLGQRLHMLALWHRDNLNALVAAETTIAAIRRVSYDLSSPHGDKPALIRQILGATKEETPRLTHVIIGQSDLTLCRIRSLYFRAVPFGEPVEAQPGDCPACLRAAEQRP